MIYFDLFKFKFSSNTKIPFYPKSVTSKYSKENRVLLTAAANERDIGKKLKLERNTQRNKRRPNEIQEEVTKLKNSLQKLNYQS